MGDTPEIGGKIGDPGVVELTGKIMVVAIIILFMVVVFVFFLHLYAKWYWNRRQGENGNTNVTARRRRRFDFAPGHQEVTVITGIRRGLDPSVLKSMSVVVFSPKDFKDGLECAVCLSEVSEGEKARILPKCNHGFHVDCIDMWFQSHSTCPLCRNPVSEQPSLSSTNTEPTLEDVPGAATEDNSGVNVYSTESPNFPTNVLFWGNEVQINTLGPCLEEAQPGPPTSSQPPCLSTSFPSTSNRPEGMLVIDIPRQTNEEEEQKSPAPTRLRSFKRLLSRDRRVSPRGPSPSNVDIEQVARSQN